jgi:hypothetical protein
MNKKAEVGIAKMIIKIVLAMLVIIFLWIVIDKIRKGILV